MRFNFEIHPDAQGITRATYTTGPAKSDGPKRIAAALARRGRFSAWRVEETGSTDWPYEATVGSYNGKQQIIWKQKIKFRITSVIDK